MSWEPPREFEEYRIVGPIGAGAMGQVFLAHDRMLDRQVAIKFISAIEIDPGVRERFFIEARAVARLSHPNVVAIHRVGEIRQRPYLVSEYVRGTSLAAVAKPLPWERVLRIGLGLARGLAAAHRRGVLHRDIKPANVMLDEDDDAKLLDFGLAKLTGARDAGEAGRRAPRLDMAPPAPVPTDVAITTSIAPRPAHEPARVRPAAASTSGVTVDGTIVGTPLYLAPELWRGEPASPRSDVYALGVVLYELLVGRAPHVGVTLDELWGRGAGPAAPIATLTSVPTRLAELVDACLGVDPDLRPATSDALVDLLEAVVPHGPSAIEGGPYRGLSSFEPEHRTLFFGRAEETRAVIERLRTETFVVVAGDSGAGKSSLCRAAVVPAIVETSLASKRWRAVTMVPGVRPRAAFERAVEARSGEEGLLLFVDQLEELLTVADPDEAAHVANQLAELVVGASHVRVLATARGDYLGRLAALPGLGELIGRALFLLGPLRERGLREAIVGPVTTLGYAFESAQVVDELIASGRAHLPLLQFTLAELWDARDDAQRRIPADALARIGGVAGALARRADQVMTALGDADREIAWRVLVRLMTADGTRAVLTRAELGDTASDPAAVARVVERLVAARLLVVASQGDDRIAVVHEALFSGWPRLVAWRRTHEQDARMRDQLAEAARQWRDRKESRGLLWRGDALLEHARWRRRWREPLTLAEMRFGQASEAEARRVRRTRLGLLGFVLAGLAAVIVLLYRSDRLAERQRNEAERQNRILLVQQGQKELDAGRAGRALPYFVEVLARGEDTPALRLLIAHATWPALRERRVIVRVPRGYSGMARSADGARFATAERGGTVRVFDAARTLVFEEDTGLDWMASLRFTPDGRWLVLLGSDGSLRRWETETWRGRVLASARPEADASAFAISPDGATAAVAHHDGEIAIWELASATRVRTFAPDRMAHDPARRRVACVEISPDGTKVIAGDGQGAIVVRDLTDGREIATLRAEPGACNMVRSASRVFVAAGTKVFAWEVLEGSPAVVFAGHLGPINGLELDAAGRQLATASDDGTARIWDANTGTSRGELAPLPRRALASARFDPAGTRIITSGSDGLFRVWDAATSRELMVIEPAVASGTAHHAPAGAADAVFDGSADRVIAASGVDVREWSVRSEPLIARHARDAAPIYGARFSPDDRWLAIAGIGRAEIWDTTGNLRTQIPLPETSWDASWSPDGRRVLLVGDGGMARLHATTGELLGTFAGHRAIVNRGAFSPDGASVVTAGDDGTARIWEATSGRELARLAHPNRVLSAVWSRDGARVATAGYDGVLRVWDAATGKLHVEMGDPATQFLDLALSPDGTRLLTAGHEGLLGVWDLASRTRVRVIVGHVGSVTGIAWSPDGALIASAGYDGAVRVWDPSSGRMLTVLDSSMTQGLVAIDWSHDGKKLVSTRETARVDLWDLRRDTRTLAELQAFMAARSSWRVVDGELVVVSAH